MNNPFEVFDEIRRAYVRYLDSPFRLRYDILLDERRRLLDADRQLYREPLFEPVSPYQTSEVTLGEACARLGVSRDAADFAACGLFPPRRRLHRHQFEAWEAYRRGRGVVVTSGTGSGKTEAFLIPIFTALVEESGRGWGTLQAPDPNRLWWNRSRQPRIRQRDHEPPQRSPAVRALLLYPLNALVEDQLGRIREAGDGVEAHRWLDRNRAGHRFWFGRYTSATPVSGPYTNAKRAELRRRLRRMEQEWLRVQASAAASGDRRLLNYFQKPEGSEMWSRWDMQEHPPDILITNYSMLNIMLMRSIERNVFDATRLWLEADHRNVFHLVVDELHSYRGTPGTEVGYLLRILLYRIGLAPDSPQLRIIATSASMDQNDPGSSSYLEQFFGRNAGTFAIIPGYPAPLGPQQNGLGEAANSLRQLNSDLNDLDTAVAARNWAAAVGVQPNGGEPDQVLAAALARIGAFEPVRAAGASRPFTLAQIALLLFGGEAERELDAAKGLIRALVLARRPDDEGRLVAPLPFRVHYFFHNAGRLWACVNAGCGGRNRNARAGVLAPPVGRLYSEPRPRCEHCGSRVLELLYCQPCGEVFIGGFKKSDPNTANAWYLSPDFPELDRVPDKAASLERTFGEYVVFWPADGRPIIRANRGRRWVWQETSENTNLNTLTLEWTPAILDHVDGRVAKRPTNRPQAGLTGGFLFEAPDDEVNAFPSKCPHCGADWWRRRVGSPIRDLGSGFQRTVQLLCDALMREMPLGGGRKLVLFSDSRQDAAKLSTGIKRFHYFDTVRQIAFRDLRDQGQRAEQLYQQATVQQAQAVELLALERRRDQGLLTEPERARRQALLASLDPALAGAIVSYAAAGGLAPAVLTPPRPPAAFMALPFRQLLDAVRARLLEIGLNPGGPLPSVTKQQTRRNDPVVWWTGLIEWAAIPRAYRENLQPVERMLMADIEGSLRRAVIQDVLFADGSRDFESLGLGYLWIRDSGPVSVTEQVAASVIRMLCQRRMWLGSDADGQPQAPGYVDEFIAAAAPVNPGNLSADVRATLGAAVDAWWMVNPDRMFLVAPRPTATGTVDEFVCGRCGRNHFHPSAGICTICRSALLPPSPRVVAADPEDYYDYLARCEDPPFRLNCEELTGQTNRVDRLIRQRRFQDVFMQDEIADAMAVDLLSVTTTMEAGVDIGALQGIGMANMPPMRFNYQQRVGRAGRRGLGMSAALTLCRGRSHDDYYFERPQLITADPPPRPYVDVTRREIAQRVVTKEVLRRAFERVQLPYSGDDVHGEFGAVQDWATTHRPLVDAWITSNANVMDGVCRAVLCRTAMDNEMGFRAMVDYVRVLLLPRIDAIAAQSPPLAALSERLASRGVLPMFGLPTGVRYLFHEPPSRRGGWPPERGVIDRDIEIAISQFAPGAQTVKDDKLHTAVGVVEYWPVGGLPTQVPNPLRAADRVGICRQCQALVEQPANTGGCPYCSAARSDAGYRVFVSGRPIVSHRGRAS